MTSLHTWLAQQLSPQNFLLEPLQGDASFRRYYRLNYGNGLYIAVESPPETEDNHGFVNVAQAFSQMNLHVPKVLAHDVEKGFFLLSDLGDELLFRLLSPHNADHLYQKSMDELAKIQQCPMDLPIFDESFMRNELSLFEEWFLQKHLNLSLSASTQQMLQETFHLLLDSAVSQPQCCIHRDYHSRNLMILSNNQIGILDFQDAMFGPITYDLVSLLRDCYIDWPDQQVKDWALSYYQRYLTQKISSEAEFIRYFDWMGIQRHLKAIFIFARKYHRDGVDLYLRDIPRTLKYVREVSARYSELQELHLFVEQFKV